MQTATAYTIITAEETEDLCTRVNAKLTEGWELRGYPFPHGRHLLQGMACSGVAGGSGYADSQLRGDESSIRVGGLVPPCYPDIMTSESFQSRSTGAAALSTDLSDPKAVPYFLWDEPMTAAELPKKLRTTSQPERMRLLGKILREARDTEVWMFTTPQEVARSWGTISRTLGRRREFWEFILKNWPQQGRLDVDWTR